MSGSEQITLEGQAVEEILKEAKRSKELELDYGALGWKKRDVLPNKRFLNNTLVSTLRHSYREDKKHKDGSYRKYQSHMNNRRRRGRNYYRNQGDRDEKEEILEPEPDGPEPDYGEFDAIAYSEKCTDLYIRDSHRKHSFMKGNFVEKRYKRSSSESDESYTEYDDPPQDKWQHDRYRGKWSDTGSADEYAAGFEEKAERSPKEDDRHRHSKYKQQHSHQGDERQRQSHRDGTRDERSPRKRSRSSRDPKFRGKTNDTDYEDAGTSKYSEEREFSDEAIPDSHTSKKKIRKEKVFVSETDEESDEECLNSGTESADNFEKSQKNKGKGKKTRKLPNDGKTLWEKISSRSMYADIEEIKMKKDSTNAQHDRGWKGDKKQMKLEREERRIKYLKQKKKEEEEEMQRKAEREQEEQEMRDEAERERKEESKRRLADRKRKEHEMRHEVERERNEIDMRRVADMQWQEEQMRIAAFQHFRGRPPRRPFRGRPFMRARPFFRGRPPRGFRGGFPMFPPINPFYASLLYEMDPYLLEKFIKEHGHKLLRKSKRRGYKSESSSRSRSCSRSRSHRNKKKKKRYYSDSDSSYSRERSKSRSRRHSSRHSSSYSRSRSRHRSRSRDRSRSRSRHRSRDHSRSRSRSRKYSSDRHSKSRSRSHRSRSHRRSYSRESDKSSDSDKDGSERSHSRSRRKYKKSRKHKKSKHRKHSKSKHKSKKTSESDSENEDSSEDDSKSENESNVEESEKSADYESNVVESEKSADNEEQSSENGVELEEGASEGEIVSDGNDGLENVSEEESGEAWSSSSEEGAIE